MGAYPLSLLCLCTLFPNPPREANRRRVRIKKWRETAAETETEGGADKKKTSEAGREGKVWGSCILRTLQLRVLAPGVSTLKQKQSCSCMKTSLDSVTCNYGGCLTNHKQDWIISTGSSHYTGMFWALNFSTVPVFLGLWIFHTQKREKNK